MNWYQKDFFTITRQNIQKGQKQNILCPLDLIEKKYKEVLNIAQKAHKVLGCRGVTRSDFKFYNNKFNILEINTQPGMTNLSLVPRLQNIEV